MEWSVKNTIKTNLYDLRCGDLDKINVVWSSLYQIT